MPLDLNNLEFREEKIIHKYFVSTSLYIILEDNHETYLDIFCNYANLDTKIIDKLNKYEEMKNHIRKLIENIFKYKKLPNAYYHHGRKIIEDIKDVKICKFDHKRNHISVCANSPKNIMFYENLPD
jgi:hypothetical protein